MFGQDNPIVTTRIGEVGQAAPVPVSNDAAPSSPSAVRFPGDGDFSRALKKRANHYFETEGGTRRDRPAMLLKSAILLTWFVMSWALLVFAATTFWQAILLSMSLGFSIAGIGMAVQHDANHGAYSKHSAVNTLFSLTLDIMGVSSFIWRQKHNVFHHTFTNVEGVDFDLDFGSIARLTPEQDRRPWHRFQHLYIWGLYGLLLPKWVLFDDFVVITTRKLGSHRLSKPSRVDLLRFAGAKLFFFGWALLVPALYHPIWQVFLFLVLASYTMGVTLGSVFQLAHCVEEADFPPVPANGERMREEWSVHQMATTVDFARSNVLLSWYLGGLNFQVEHHLFPKVSHMHYPALSRIVEEVASEHGVRYRSTPTFSGSLASHYRHLRGLGQRQADALVSPIGLPAKPLA